MKMVKQAPGRYVNLVHRVRVRKDDDSGWWIVEINGVERGTYRTKKACVSYARHVLKLDQPKKPKDGTPGPKSVSNLFRL